MWPCSHACCQLLATSRMLCAADMAPAPGLARVSKHRVVCLVWFLCKNWQHVCMPCPHARMPTCPAPLPLQVS